MKLLFAFILTTLAGYLSHLPLSLAQDNANFAYIIDMAWDGNNTYLGISTDQGVYILDSNYDCLIKLHDEPMQHIAWHADKPYLAGIQSIREIDIPEIYVWDISAMENAELVKRFQDTVGSLGFPLMVDWHPTQNWLLFNGPGVSIWDIETQTIIFTSRNASDEAAILIRDRNVAVNAAGWSPAGDYFAGLYRDWLRIWRTADYSLVHEIALPEDGSGIMAMAWHNAGHQIAVAHPANITIFDAASGALVQTLPTEYSAASRNLIWQDDYLAFLQVSPTPTIHVWDTASNSLMLSQTVDEITDIAWHPSHTGVVYWSEQDGWQMLATPFVVTDTLLQHRLEAGVGGVTIVQ